MELLIIATLIVVAWFAGDKRGRERVDEYAAADDRPAAYGARGLAAKLDVQYIRDSE